MIKTRQCDCLKCICSRYLGIEVDRAGTNRLRCFVGAERIAAFCLRLRRIGDWDRPSQAVGDHGNSAGIAVLQFDFDLADWFAASVCLDEAVIEGNLEICLTCMNWEGGALNYRLENRL
jgi:hypothetical protein